jgi:large repetitive protein
MHGRSVFHVMRRACAHCALLLVLVLPASALAQTYTHSALIDSDNDAMTGCTATTAAGSVSGVELRVTASVSAFPPQVDSVTREVCTGGVFGAPVAIGGGYPVALNTGVGGADAIEMAFAVSSLPGVGTEDWQVAFQSESALGADQMGPVTVAGIGIAPPAVQLPALSRAGLIGLAILMAVLLMWGARRHRGMLSVLLMCASLSFVGLAWAANFITDGDLSDWIGEAPVATDPNGDSTSGQDNIDLVAGFIARESGQIFLRVDVVDAEAQNLAPIVADQSFNLDENSANATAVGTVVASDLDVGDILTYAISAGNGAGTFAIDANTGAITVANNAALDFETTPSFALTVSVTDDGTPNLTSSATITINLNDLNEAPSIADQSFNVLEDSANGTVVGTAAGTDPDGTAPNNTLGYAITAGNTGGAFAIDGNGQITVASSAAIVVANAPFNLTVTVTDGGAPNLSATAAVTVSVTHVNHEPTFTPGGDQVVLEDAGAQTVPAWAMAIDDGDGGSDTLSFNVTANTNMALFSTQPAVDPVSGNLTFTPAADANGSASITLELMDNGGTANGGDDTSPAATFVITVTAVNDVPSFTKGADESVVEDSGAQSVANWATGISAGPADESAQTLTFNVTGNTNPGLFSAGPSVAANGTLSYTVAAASSGTADVSIALMDNGGTANGGVDTSAAQTFTIEVVAINHEPSFTPGADVNANEDAGLQTVAGWATAIDDGDGNTQVLTFNISGNTNAALFSTQPAVNPANGDLTFTSAANANGSATITLNLMDDGGTAFGGDDTSPSAMFTINVGPVNDAPSFTAGAVQTVFEDSGAQSVPGWATAISPGPADESGQAVTFNVSNDNNALFSVQPAVAANGTLSYTPAPDAFGTANISVTAMDDGGTANGGVDTSAAQVVAINVTGINDAPSFTSGGNTNSDEDAGAQTVAGWASAISDGDANTQTLTFNVTNNSNAALFSTAPAVNASNGNLTYTAAPNANGSATITLTLSDNGGTANGGVDTSAAVMFTITINPVNDPPIVTNAPSFTVHSNIGISQPDDATVDLLGSARGISDIDSAGPYTVGTVGTGMATTGGGVIDIAADGSFSYDPPINATGADTFVYTICDAGTPMPPACVPVTLTLNISGPRIVFVDDSASGTGATGTLRHPLTNVPAGLSALSSGAGSTDLFVFSGSYALPAVQNLANNVRVIGQAATAASFDTLYGLTPPALSDTRPALSQPAPVLGSASTGCLGLGQNNTLRGLTIGNCSGTAIAGTGFATLTVTDNVVISNGFGAALSLTNGTAAATFASVTAAGGNPDVNLTTIAGNLDLGSGALSGATGGLRVSGGSANIDYSGSMSITGGRVVDIQNKTGGTVNLSGTITHSSGAPQGILLANNTGATVNFSNTLTLSTATNAAFTATGGGTVTATGGTASTLATTTGLAVNVVNTTIGLGGLNFRSVSSNGGVNGIILNNTGAIASLVVTGTGTTAGSGGTIQNKTGDGIRLESTRNVSLANMNLINTASTGSPSPPMGSGCGTNLQDNITCTAAIDMQTVSNITLNGLNISGGQQYGINGNAVAAFSMTATTISNSGNDIEEDGVRFINLTGTSLIRNSTIQDSHTNNLRIYNTVSTALNLTVDETVAGTSRFLRALNNDGILMEGLNSANMTLNVSDTDFDSSDGDHIQTAIDDAATMNVTIANNTMTAANPAVLGSGITLSSSADFSGGLTYSITGNTINGSNAKSINVNLGTTTAGTGTYTGTIANNAIGTSGVAQSGGAGMDVVANGNGTLNAIVTNNTIRQFASDHGIRILHRDGAGRINATVTGNTVTQPEPGGFNGVVVQAGASSTLPDSGTICLDINGNTMAGSGAGGGSATDFRLRQRFSTTIQLRGYGGTSTDTAAVVSYVQGINPGAETGSATADGAPGGGFVNSPGGAACN